MHVFAGENPNSILGISHIVLHLLIFRIFYLILHLFLKSVSVSILYIKQTVIYHIVHSKWGEVVLYYFTRPVFCFAISLTVAGKKLLINLVLCVMIRSALLCLTLYSFCVSAESELDGESQIIPSALFRQHCTYRLHGRKFCPCDLSAVFMTLFRAFLSACVMFPYQTVMPAVRISPL